MQSMKLNIGFCCPVCKKRKAAYIDHTACKAELSKMAEKNKRKRPGTFPAQRYMNHLRSCGAID